ncbi:MAG: hypothetical protein EZS28_056661, partial [Streblomastix strix]
GRRIEENNGLSTAEHTIEIPTFYNERSEQGPENKEERRLGMLDGYQIGVQPQDSNQRIGEIPGLYAQWYSLYAGQNAIHNLDNSENLCKDNININRQSKKRGSSSDSKLCRRHSASDVGSVIVGQRNRVDCIEVQEIWIGDQREQEQVEARITICVPEID